MLLPLGVIFLGGEKSGGFSSASHQDDTKENRLPFHIKTRKLDKIYEMMAETHWPTGNTGPRPPKEKETEG